ncbi:protein GVQW3-like [Dreissena polymorpha]|uniref:protein GVQW3-like n=1 Tax=Dreissena polymorpha TaxID=45954 RepID=UPI002264EDE9|nr:protein GVQW3-like [Dreissena polymorpha]
MPSVDNVELRTVIKFCHSLGYTQTKTFEEVKKSKQFNCSRSLVFKWHDRFRKGRESVEDDARSGRPALVKQTMTDKLRDLIKTNRRLTVPYIAEELGIGISMVYRILTEDFKMRKVRARWVPKLLSDEERVKRVKCSEEFLRRYRKEGERFLDHIVTLDETWLWHYDPETKAQSSVWKTAASPPPKKARVMKSGGKHIYIFFMDRRGMLLIHKVPDGQTINATYYQKVLRRDLMNALR